MRSRFMSVIIQVCFVAIVLLWSKQDTRRQIFQILLSLRYTAAVLVTFFVGLCERGGFDVWLTYFSMFGSLGDKFSPRVTHPEINKALLPKFNARTWVGSLIGSPVGSLVGASL